MNNSKKKNCQNCKAEFIIEPEDFEFYQKIDVPEPTFCPECRTIRRLMMRNENKLFMRKDDHTGENIFSMYPLEETDIKVYDHKYWWSDNWEPMEFGREYDFRKNFFEQIRELINDVPWVNRSILDSVDSDYCANASYQKGCYYVFDGTLCEGCAYSNNIEKSKDSYDNYYLMKCELCYQCFMLTSCHQSFFSSFCEDCHDIYFCKNCIACSDCFGCVNLKHKKYHIFNQEYSKEEYFEKLKELDVGSFEKKEKLLKEAKRIWSEFPVRFMRGRKNVDVTGEYINNSKNVQSAYMINDVEDSKYFQFSFEKGTRDCYDATIVGWNSILTYENCIVGKDTNNVRFSFECYPDCYDMEYCVHCHSCSSLFACSGLRKKQYCIFNKQYTKQEYEQLVPRIKKQMDEVPFTDKSGCIYKYGEFFPPEIFPFSYNNTIAQEYFPLTKEKAIEKGYRWYDKQKSDYKPTIKAKDLPDHTKDTGENVLKEVIECANHPNRSCQGSGVFRIISKELQFYQKHNLPLPRLCPDCRHSERIKQRNPMKLHKRQCMCDHKAFNNQQEHSHGEKPCPNTFQTTYSSDRKEIVYCRECYQKEVE